MREKKKKRKVLLLAVFCLSLLFLMTGCGPSQKRVESSSYYQELQQENEDLEAQIEELKEGEEETDTPKADEERASDFLDKIARNTLVKLEVGYADHMEGSEFVENEAAFVMATVIAKRADLTQKYTPDEVEELYGPGYEYVLYDEDNAVYELFVYGGNYVVFTDLPNNVYYAYNASALGEAFLHYQNGYPNSSLLHRLADCPLITDEDGICYENETAYEAANAIDRIDKKKSSREKAQSFWDKKAAKKNQDTFEPKSAAYTFYHHGNQMVLTIYDRFISILNMDGNTTWYKGSRDDIKALKAIFKKAAEENAENLSGKNQGGSGRTASHSSEIQEESGGSSSAEE